MKTPSLNSGLLRLASAVAVVSTALAQSPADPGWPRVYKQDKKQLTVYQPQVDYWHGYTNIHFRCAIAVKGVLKEERFGVAEVDAVTVTDHANRIVAIVPLKRELRFANVPEPDLTKLRQAADQLRPMGQATTLALDRVIAYLDPAKQPVQHAVEVNLDPPKIFSSTTPAILVIFMGEPRFKPVETNRTDLLFALNTNWDVLYDTASRQYYLLNGEGWLTAPDVIKGPWTPAQTMPPSLYSLPASGNWAEARRRLPGKPAKVAPTVVATTEPAEMIVTDGPPSFLPVKGTRLMRVNNTTSVLFLHTGDGKYCFLVAGRWFRGGSLNGPWSAASTDLPADFAQIPDNDPAAFVKASVPGTREAKDAVLLASIPTTTTVNITNVTVNVTYSGAPTFVVITNTTIQYAVNTPKQVFLVNGGYYCCDQGVWFCSTSATGPWTFCTTVPSVIYTIPPSHPTYNVTYVVVQSSTPTTVTYSQTSGYSGEYVASTGVLMFGMGMLIGAAIADDDHYYYYPRYPCYYSYGCCATYHYGYGGYYSRGGGVYGPYGGAGYSASYNPYSGTYSRSSYAYGPYGSGSRSATYNPYSGKRTYESEWNTAYSSGERSASYDPSSGKYSRSGEINTAYGSAERSASYNRSSGQYSASSSRTSAYGTTSTERNYNAYTGQGSASRQTTTDYGSASRGAAYDAQTGARAAGGSVSTDYGTVSRGAAYNPSTGQGAKGASWDTANSQGAVAKTSSGDVYASNGDTVYRKDSDGNWSQNSGSGWESTDSPQQQRQSQASANQQQAQSQASSAQPQRSTSTASGTTASSSSISSRQSQAESQASSRQQQAQSQASMSQQQRSSASTSNWSQQRSSMESQAQSRSWGNQQHQSSQSWQSSAGSRSGSGSRGGSYGGSHGGGGGRRR